jgi:hypothetical protein
MAQTASEGRGAVTGSYGHNNDKSGTVSTVNSMTSLTRIGSPRSLPHGLSYLIATAQNAVEGASE